MSESSPNEKQRKNRPPVGRRSKKGQSGNPKGRPPKQECLTSQVKAELQTVNQPMARSKEQREVVIKAIVEEEAKALGLIFPDVAQDLIHHSARLQFHANRDMDRVHRRMLAFTAIMEMKPEGIIQTRLSVQMIGTHNAAVEFLSRATMPDQTTEAIDRNVARATRLMRLFNEQCELMQKLKGQHGQQKIVVERVEVHQGGKAMVGAITAGSPVVGAITSGSPEGGREGHEEKK